MRVTFVPVIKGTRVIKKSNRLLFNKENKIKGSPRQLNKKWKKNWHKK